ncbi:hypothetical protein [Telluribacter sp.]|jgi:hypothetical protein|uniref:hypothetical protein n=1 Tax=Telluribacter sp. TaxID=1978767 RepID=UPI002E121C15|nr:hypothetical protein [Telluribacter sp.]
MTKGHNKGSNDAHQSQEDVKRVPGQTGHLKNKDTEKISNSRKGRNKEDDQSGGTKGQNAI